MSSTKPIPAAVTEAVDRILTQASIGEHYRPDFLKHVQHAYDAGAEANHVKIHAPPLTDAEILVFRDVVRSLIPAPTKTEVQQ